MSDKTFNSRIQLKHDIATHWELATGFAPKAGELIIYDPDADHPEPRIKIGDGVTNVNLLPFINGMTQEEDDELIIYCNYNYEAPTKGAE